MHPRRSSVLRRHLRKLKTAHANAQPTGGGFSSADIPKNAMLESSVSQLLVRNKDARAMISFCRGMLDSQLLSLASPVGRWDPYDIKPQVFALDNYVALPVFSSLRMMQFFCSKFNFSVRDPSGNIWYDPRSDLLTAAAAEADGTRPGAAAAAAASPAAATSSNTACPSRDAAKTPDIEVVDAQALQMMLDSDATDEVAVVAAPVKKRRPTRNSFIRRSTRLRVQTILNSMKSSAPPPLDSDADTSSRFQAAADVKAFDLAQATPLPLFGPLQFPFFIGYFADVDTLLQNAAIVPQRVDLVLNPASPLELVLARQATNQVLHKEDIMKQAHMLLQRELQREFYDFFAKEADEVSAARSLLMPRPTPTDSPTAGIEYEVLITFSSANDELTMHRLKEAKKAGRLTGHECLHVMPDSSAPAFIHEGAKLFFQRSATAPQRQQQATSSVGKFRQLGKTVTLQASVTSDNYFSDPSMVSSEAHEVFSSEMKWRPQT